MTDPQSEWRWRIDRADGEVETLRKWQLNVVAEISELRADLSSIKTWFQIGVVGMLGMTGSIVVWLLTGHKP